MYGKLFRACKTKKMFFGKTWSGITSISMSCARSTNMQQKEESNFTSMISKKEKLTSRWLRISTKCQKLTN